MKALIIGAGPVGSYTAYLLAMGGHKVRVIEEHKEIGKPVQCTGLVTSGLLELDLDVSRAIVRRIAMTEIISQRTLRVSFTKPDIILDRTVFDSLIARAAEKAGAEFILGERVRKVSASGTAQTARGNYKADAVIGADGPRSVVAEKINPELRRESWTGIQLRARGDFGQSIKFFPRSGSYAWIVPERDGYARVGVAAARDPAKLAGDFFSKLPEHEVIERQGGLIPVYDPKVRTSKGKLHIIGDAAGMVKATTGGGIIPGMRAAHHLAESPSTYDKAWRKSVGRELRLHLALRRLMDSFSAKDWARMFGYCSSDRARRTLQDIDRDHLARLAMAMLIAQPKLFYFAFKMNPQIFI